MALSKDISPAELAALAKGGKANEVWELLREESNGLLDLFELEKPGWLAETIAANMEPWIFMLRKKEQLYFAVDCAERVLHIYEEAYPGDARVRTALEIFRAYLNGDASQASFDNAMAVVDDAAGAANQTANEFMTNMSPINFNMNKAFHAAVQEPSHAELDTTKAENQAKRQALRKKRHANFEKELLAKIAQPPTLPSQEAWAEMWTKQRAADVARSVSYALSGDVSSAQTSAAMAQLVSTVSIISGNAPTTKPKDAMMAIQTQERRHQAECLLSYLRGGAWRLVPEHERLDHELKQDAHSVWVKLTANNNTLLQQIEREVPGWLNGSFAANLVQWVPLLDDRDRYRFATDCAERVLPIYENAFPGDVRARRALDVLRSCGVANQVHEATKPVFIEAMAAAMSCPYEAPRNVLLAVSENPDGDSKKIAVSAASFAVAAIRASHLDPVLGKAALRAEQQWQAARFFAYLRKER